METLTILWTGRLWLRRFTATARDLDALASLHGDPEVMRRIDDGRPQPRETVAARTLPGILRQYDELPPGTGCFAVESRTDGRFLGWLSLRPPSSVGLAAAPAVGRGAVLELGYRLLPGAWGHGYATEGARALVRHAFTVLGAEQVVATTMTVNSASRRVLEKAGLTLVRTFFEEWPEYIEGAERGDVEYAVSRAEWAQGPAAPSA
ncbi:GNAT family N-acetyltransferase [Streptacidiphilus anmyonensis]|uniref:GNAT family N-acetyltransferase n=1 Tax=Streptacidiphilus anmyonensis TaxID=405782 RepID=UPI000AB65A3C|nr:GNAT family N-acetyltransferase [Streptacidiphilus anmyonensis]